MPRLKARPARDNPAGVCRRAWEVQEEEIIRRSSAYLGKYLGKVATLLKGGSCVNCQRRVSFCTRRQWNLNAAEELGNVLSDIFSARISILRKWMRWEMLDF